jgi:hypothetical protein
MPSLFPDPEPDNPPPQAARLAPKLRKPETRDRGLPIP